MRLTDTHCHLDLDKFDADRGEVIQRAREEGVDYILIPALNLDTWSNLIKLTQYHAGIYTAFGFHPTELDKWNNSSPKNLRLLLQMDKVVAVGEIGLDYYWVKELDQQAYQRDILKQQLKLAAEVNRPVILHMREENDVWFGRASIDLLDILTKWCQELRQQNHPLAGKPGVLHSFNGNLATAQTAIALNFYIGVTGPVTYKNAEEKRQIIRQLPLERLLIETDSPFLAPVPHRGKRNEPAFVAHIADKIAEIHSTTREQIANITASNAADLFGWGG